MACFGRPGFIAVDQRMSTQDAPHRYWSGLVHRVHAPGGGFRSLSSHEQAYYAVATLVGDVLNGGFHAFFSNQPGDVYGAALDGLVRMEAADAHRLTAEAKALLFGEKPVPLDFAERNRLLPDIESLDRKDERGKRLDALESAFCEDPDGLDDRLARFAQAHGLYVAEAR